MANPVQWTVDAVYRELGKLAAAYREELGLFEAQKTALTADYGRARNAGDAAAMAALKPLITRSNQARLGLREFVAKFNDVVRGASDALRRAGLQVPGQLGAVPAIVVPAIVAVGIAAAWDILRRSSNVRMAVEDNRASILRIAADPNVPAADKRKLYDAAIAPPPAEDPFGFGKLVPIVFGIAAIVVLPKLLKFIPGREHGIRRAV